MINDYKMQFGSMCNSFGLINHGKGMDADIFLQEIEKILNYAKELENPVKTITGSTKNNIVIPTE